MLMRPVAAFVIGVVRVQHSRRWGSILQTHMEPARRQSTLGALLSQLYWRKNDIPNYHQAIVKLCQMHLKAQNIDAAWEDFGEYLNSARAYASPYMLELCRAAEGQQNF